MSEEAEKVSARLDGHEILCAERYKNIEAAVTRMSSAIERMGGRINGAAVALIGGLFAVVAFFIAKHGV